MNTGIAVENSDEESADMEAIVNIIDNSDSTNVSLQTEKLGACNALFRK